MGTKPIVNPLTMEETAAGGVLHEIISKYLFAPDSANRYLNNSFIMIT